ncbi:Quinol monooxygenase YgiN [Carnobacterium iners]|uniref:Quinol monooxygenase YgiN n=1 Tax=Carnobacterium iners TaxID=1073423 RepID=A0A1X7MYR0_9LACT|nr:putative quinol monooxygenase [Carnobacterium iners]SEK18386.1 Quinol monooxygenase YgiN [Carnobacterium iners]SMH29632.1 Quinol monooxygenase YgiN [Carnobacterium iners]
MKIINATFFIKEYKRDKFLATVTPLIEATLLEEGCIGYHLYESFEEPNRFIMIENRKNQAAINAHNKNPLLLDLFNKLPTYSSKQPILTISTLEEK